MQALNSPGDDRQQYDKDTAEVGERVYHEMNGRAKPSELQGTPRAELDSRAIKLAKTH